MPLKTTTQSTTPNAIIRRYNHATDADAIDHVFRITADSGLQSSPDPRTLEYASHIWCHPYPALWKGNCFVVAVLDSGTGSGSGSDEPPANASDNPPGKAVGYILSTPDTYQHSTRFAEEYLPSLPSEIRTPLPPDADVIWRPDNLPNALLHRIQHSAQWPADIEADVPGVLARYPAHLHIDVLPEFQGIGFGTRLMRACLERLRNEGVKGVHLQMVEGNTAARAFYKAVGFTQWSDTLKGEWCMVKEL